MMDNDTDDAAYSVDLNNSRFGVPLGLPVITPLVALLVIQFATASLTAST